MIAVALGLSATATTAQSQATSTPAQIRTAETVATPPLGVRSWGYQLQGVDPNVLVGVPYDAIVIDYSRDGSAQTALSRADVERLQRKPDGQRRIVLAYMSIGEAESYRYYWSRWWSDFWFIPNVVTKPSWRGKLNGEWGGNYAVRYWDPAWQTIITGPGGYLDRIAAAGFDGVWLDKVDSSMEDVATGRPSAKADMIAFVKQIGDRGRAAKPGFLVFPQNGELLLSDPAYRAVIDGIGKEGLLYGEDGPGKPNTAALIRERADLLKLLVAEGKPVFAVEYLNDPARIDAARARLAADGFIPHFGDVLLGVMRVGDYPSGAAQTAAGPRPPRRAAAAAAGNGPTRFESWKTYGLLGAIVIVALFALFRIARTRRS